MAAYAQHHGWDLVLSSEHLSDRPPSWSKLILVQELTQRYEYVWWIDADAIIVALDRDILAEVGGEADIWFARHPQDRDPDATVLNAGVFLARSGAFTRDLFQAMWDREEFIEHNWWENAALLDLLGYSLEAPFPKVRETDWDGRIGTLDLAWNSVPGYCESPDAAVNHHAGAITTTLGFGGAPCPTIERERWRPTRPCSNTCIRHRLRVSTVVRSAPTSSMESMSAPPQRSTNCWPYSIGSMPTSRHSPLCHHGCCRPVVRVV